MNQGSELDEFLQRVVNISVLRMGGVAGMIGWSSTDNTVLNNLKKSAIDFAVEYKKPDRSKDEIRQLANDVEGYIQTLQLTNTLSETEGNKLIDELRKLVSQLDSEPAS